MGSLNTRLPYWQVNVPEAERTAACPEFLRNLSAKDIGIISTPDAEYRRSSWPEVRELVRNNRLDLFQRVPSQLRRYLGYTWQLRRDYGSIMDFILACRLRWDVPVVPAGSAPFEHDGDVRILRNDWPYGIDERIAHLVVWTKFELEEDPVTTDLTPAAREQIEAYVRRKFGSRLPRDQYIWFKNWKSLKSVQAVEHFHVMIFDPDPAFIDEITGGDVPLCQKV